MDDRSEAVLAEVAELERRDTAVAATIERVTALLGRADEVRAGATRVRERLEAIPGDVAATERAERDARERERTAREELAAAETRAAEVARSRRAGDAARAAAQREVDRAREALLAAGTRIGRLAERRTALGDEERALRAQADGLAVAALGVAADISELPRISDSGRRGPGATLAELEEWGARAHAALFVVRGGLESERERIVQEAGALGASALGEHLAGSSVALVRRRLEQALSG